MIYDIIGFMVLLFLSGVAIFAVGIHFFIAVASLFSKPVAVQDTGRYVRVNEKEYDYDTDY